MYVILRGSVSVLKCSDEFGSLAVVVNTLLDGDKFGELSLISTANNCGVAVGRAATCIATETCDLLMIPKHSFH
jgi:CRP-like cAMP-binding protein